MDDQLGGGPGIQAHFKRQLIHLRKDVGPVLLELLIFREKQKIYNLLWSLPIFKYLLLCQKRRIPWKHTFGLHRTHYLQTKKRVFTLGVR